MASWMASTARAYARARRRAPRSPAPATQRLEARGELGIEVAVGGEREQVAIVAGLAAEQERETRRGLALRLGRGGRCRGEDRQQGGDLVDELRRERLRPARTHAASARHAGREAARVADELAERMTASGHGTPM